jgi:Predicted glutamine amidotransferases
MHHFPLIGITTNPNTPKTGLAYDKLAQNYCQAIQTAGGIPVMLPSTLSHEDIRQLRSRLDGILLSGGGDIAATRYQESEDVLCDTVSFDRDEVEFALVHLAVETNWPLLGICRGLQVINAALGGTLYTDLPTQYASTLVHSTADELGRDYAAHEVTISQGTRLAGILGESQLRVNSFHHQAVKRIAEGLKVAAHASDGLVEGLENPELHFFLGVQWHPECLPNEAAQRALFSAFTQAAGD